MPIYEYRCNECGKSFEHQERIGEHEKNQPECPGCGSREVQQVVAPFFAQTAKKS